MERKLYDQITRQPTVNIQCKNPAAFFTSHSRTIYKMIRLYVSLDWPPTDGVTDSITPFNKEQTILTFVLSGVVVLR